MQLRIVAILLLLHLSTFYNKVYSRSIQSSTGIQIAIDQAKAGDTIYIPKRVYKEHDILIRKRLTLIGQNYPIVDGQGKYQLFIINADSVILKGFQIENSGQSSMDDIAGIKIMNVSSVQVINNRLLNNTYGIYMQNSSYDIVHNNIISSNSKDELSGGNGIHAWKCNHLYIKGNSISGHRDGIYFEFVTSSQIVYNASFNNVRYGLHFMFSHNNTYTSNLFSDNGAGVAVMYSKGVVMYKNIFNHNWGDASYGLLLKEISDSRIEGNHFINNTIGIFMDGTTRIYCIHNEYKSNGWAMRVQANCNDNTFFENNFIGNSFDVATNGTMVLSSFKRNYWDKYDGYDLDKNNMGDVPYYPVSVYSVITEKIPTAMILYRSFLTDIMDKVEKVMPSIIPDQLKDDQPLMKKLKL